MKKSILFLVIALCSVVSVGAQERIDTEGNTVDHSFFVVAEYQIGDFDYAKESGCYGLGFVVTSISHWDAFHVGCNVNLSTNAGLIDPSGMIVDFGPSVRYDINKHFFVNMPVDAVCAVYFPEGTTDRECHWGAKIAPSLHAFLSKNFGVFAGPKVQFGSGSTKVGMQAGISVSF